MAVNSLEDIVIGANAIPQRAVLPFATAQERVKTKNLEGHVKRQLTSLGKVSLLVLVVVHSATIKMFLRNSERNMLNSPPICFFQSSALLFTTTINQQSGKNMH